MSVILFTMSEKKQNQNTEKNTEKEYSSLYGDIVMDKLVIATNKLDELYDLMHKLVNNPYKLKSMGKMINFKVSFKQKLTIPSYISMILFGEKDTKITGIEIEGNIVYIYYEINNEEYREYIDFGASRLTVKEYVLFLIVFKRISDNDLFEITNMLSDIIAEISNEKDCVMNILKENGIKIEN